jgi:hypothetical protein
MAITYPTPVVNNTTGDPNVNSLKVGSDNINDAFENIKAEFSTLGTAATRDVTTSATDTTTVRVLKVGDWGIGSLNTNVPNLTANEANYGRIARALSGATGGPGIDVGFVSLPRDGAPSTGFLAVGVNGRAFSGFKASANGTPLWRELYSTGNILGTVSQSGGVPTGAIIQKGSYTTLSGTMYWQKYADGRVSGSIVIPKEEFEASATFSSTSQGIIFYRSEVVTVATTPLSFVDSNYSVSVNLFTGTSGTRTAWGQRRTNVTSSVQIQLTSTEQWTSGGTAIGNLVRVELQLEGRWY